MEEKSHNELLTVRREKLEALRALGVAPFGERYETTASPGEVRATFSEGIPIRTAGRITAHRNMGKSHFLDISDSTGRIQVYLNSKEIGPDSMPIFDCLDIGDFIGIEGVAFTTKAGEQSIKASAFTVLAKSLRPLP